MAEVVLHETSVMSLSASAGQMRRRFSTPGHVCSLFHELLVVRRGKEHSAAARIEIVVEREHALPRFRPGRIAAGMVGAQAFPIAIVLKAVAFERATLEAGNRREA